MTKRRPFEDTEVPADRSKAEIRALVLRYGATQFGIIEAEDRAQSGFVAGRCLIRLEVPLPQQSAGATTRQGKWLRPGTAAARKVHEQDERRIWRAVRVWIFAQLEAVESGIRTFEQAFLADTVLPTGQTFSAWAEPQIERQVAAGQMPALLPAGVQNGVPNAP